MEEFKARWDIDKNWQFIFPILGVLILFYCSYKLTGLFREEYHIGIKLGFALLIFFFLLKFVLLLFKKLEKKWLVVHRWELIRVFMVFAITGSSSLFVGRPIIKLMGITKENLNIYVYWFLYIIIGIVFYQILLVCFGWLFGQFKFFWEFEKKMIRRFGLRKFVDYCINLNNHISIKLLALALVIAVSIPTIVKFAHILENHKHEVCTAETAPISRNRSGCAFLT